ncbi:MAG: spondin domain-containing protein, partial [Cyanobacteria bacterium J06600_6]
MPQTNVTVTVENLAPANGTFITPVWVGFHNGEFDTYDQGRQASFGLESLAEDGATSGIAAEFIASGNGAVEGTLLGLEGVEGPIDPGETVSQTFTLDSDDPNSHYLNYASMVLPSNDAFIANGDPLGVPVFDAEGNFIGADFIIYGSEVLDAGTEINDEAIASTAFFGQSAPNTGETEAGVVELHPGFAPEGRILSENGSDQNAVAAFTSADFTEPGYQLARISVRNTDEPLPPASDLVEVTITVENLSPENGTALTPLWFGLHDGNFDTYDRGRPVSGGLESLAEDGATAGISSEFLASGAGFIDGAVTGDGGATPGIIDVGETTSLTFTVDRSLASSRYLNYASMVLPSNDAFIANGNPLAHQIFDADGNFTGADFVIAGDEVLDAGTEVNDEAADSTAFFGQSAPNTGETEGGMVQSHPGFAP